MPRPKTDKVAKLNASFPNWRESKDPLGVPVWLSEEINATEQTKTGRPIAAWPEHYGVLVESMKEKGMTATRAQKAAYEQMKSEGRLPCIEFDSVRRRYNTWLAEHLGLKAAASVWDGDVDAYIAIQDRITNNQQRGGKKS